MLREARRHPATSLAPDPVVVEEPLEVRLDDAPVAVIMRTPGDDFELAVGFLYSESLLAGAADVAGIAWCRDPGESGPTNVVNVASATGAGAAAVAERRRAVITSSACGLCGRVTLDQVRLVAPPPGPPARVDEARLAAAMARLQAGQATFEETGASHGACVLDPGDQVVAAFEDVGRHNAVDKCVGRLLLTEAVPLHGHLLVVSGRVSFEIVQKAAMAAIPAVAGVGGATSLAVDLARERGMLLAAFTREGRATVYSGTLG